MGLRDDREIPLSEPFDYPHLPERLAAVELLRHQASDEALELPLIARARKMGVAHVVGEVEAPVVHPHRLAERRGRLEALAVAREAVEARLHQCPHARDVDSALRLRQRTALEQRDGTDVHVAVAVLDLEEAVVERREPFEVGVRHAPPSHLRRARSEPSESRRLTSAWLSWAFGGRGNPRCGNAGSESRRADCATSAGVSGFGPFRFVRWSFPTTTNGRGPCAGGSWRRMVARQRQAVTKEPHMCRSGCLLTIAVGLAA